MIGAVASPRGAPSAPLGGDPARPRRRRALPPGGRRRGDDRARKAALEARSRGCRPARRAASGGQRRSSLRRTARRPPPRWPPGSSARRSGSRTTTPAPTSSRASPRLCSRLTGRAARALRGRRGGPARGRAAAAAARRLPRQPLPRPARPLRRARARRGALAGDGRGAAGRRCPRRERGRSAGRRPRACAARRRRSASTTRATPRAGLQHAADSKWCVRCGTPYTYAAAYIGHLGDYRCAACGHARPPLDVAARRIELNGLESVSFDLDTPEGSRRVELGVPGLYNVYNALAAASLARALGAGLEAIVHGLQGFSAAFGRFERIALGDRTLLVLLIKNPAGANEVVRTLVAGGAPGAARDRPERRDRGRARRLLDLGRRLRAAARRSRPARRDRRTRSRAGAAVQVRGARRRTGSRSCPSSSRRSTAGWS